MPAPPELLTNAHVQTVLGVSEWPTREPVFSGERRTIDVKGGMIDARFFPAAGNPSRVAALVLHGITGSATDPTIIRTARKLAARGVNAMSITMRGGPGSGECKPPLFHAGSTDDVRAALAFLMERHERVAATGISLGGHLLLLSLAEWGKEAPDALKGVVAISPPLDIDATSTHLEEKTGRVYQRYMVRRLIARAGAAHPLLAPDVRANLVGPPSKVVSVRTYNAMMSVPVYGYRDLDEYHRHTNVACRMHAIERPALVIQAMDDPVVPARTVLEAVADSPPFISAIVTKHGGHVGFIAKARPFGDPDRRWAENRAVDFVCAALC